MSELIHMYNKHTYANGNKSLLSKSLDSTTAKGEALVPEHLENVITNTIVRLSPTIAVLDLEFNTQKSHEFNRITSLPKQGGAMGEGSVTPTRNSVYVRAAVPLKIIKRKGAVTGFLQDASAKNIDAVAAEMESHLLAHTYDLDYYSLHGNAGANPFEYSGWDVFISTFRQQKQLVSGGTIPTDLQFLDDLIDSNTRKQGAKHKKVFFMSPEMLSKVSRLLTNVRLNQGLSGAGLTQVNINGGWRMQAYRNIPIIETTATRPTSTMTTVVATAFTSGGSLADDEYFFTVVPITYDGEQNPSAIVSATVSGASGNGRVDLTFTAFPGVLGYKVYQGLSTGFTNLLLRKAVSAFTYDPDGTITGDTETISFTSTTPGADVPTNMQNDLPLFPTGNVPSEIVALIDMDKFQGMGKLAFTNRQGDRFNGLVNIEPLAKVDDNIPFLIKSYPALIDSFEATSGLIRGLRVE